MYKTLLHLMLLGGTTLCGAGAVYLQRPPQSDQTATELQTTDAASLNESDWGIVCNGRVEAIHGEVDVSAQIPGRLAEVRVKEGDVVDRGDVIAVLQDARQAADVQVAEAAVELARARLQRLEAGNGQEEIDQARFEWKSVEAQLVYETASFRRSHAAFQKRAVSAEELDRKRQRVEQLQRQCDALQKQYEAIQRGSLPEEIRVARAELAVAEQQLRRARVENEYCIVRAPIAGTVTHVYRHTGDSVIVEQPTPIVRLADTGHLRIRLEVDERDVPRLQSAMEGQFTVPGIRSDIGRLTIRTVVPMFGPTRLFNPDTSARVDTRVLDVLCDVTETRVALYPGQRVTACFNEAGRNR